MEMLINSVDLALVLYSHKSVAFFFQRGTRGETSGRLQDILQFSDKSKINQCLQKARITGIFLQSVSLNNYE